MLDEGALHDQVNSLRAQNSTLKQQIDRLVEQCRTIKDTLCAREKSDGSFNIDYAALVKKLGAEGAGDLRNIIDEVFGVEHEVATVRVLDPAAALAPLVGKTVTIIAAKPGEKPKLRIHAAEPAKKAKRKAA